MDHKIVLKELFSRACLVFATLAIVAFGSSSHAKDRAQKTCPRPWVFFDLGGVLIDTDTNGFSPMFLLPRANEYVQALAELGHPLGLITDVPQEWGRDLPRVRGIRDEVTAKWVRTILFLQGRVPADGVSWQGEPFNWRVFGRFTGRGSELRFEGRVFLPATNEERKGTGNPILFQRARAAAAQAGCPLLYMSEDQAQLDVAAQVGVITYRVGGHGLVGPFYLPPDSINTYIERYQKNARRLAPQGLRMAHRRST